ncbi:MAG: hypothetical protein EZS28_026115 [Streblomastix strix]|uniref:Uncharacterized protein n=1 Tax=Streblomastix strix TaxID=222440 RepID=A0A5J4V6U7_9EUKA|nr:MAG: hypothetical protein EZS28_026115 [Streblomastix strix]
MVERMEDDILSTYDKPVMIKTGEDLDVKELNSIDEGESFIELISDNKTTRMVLFDILFVYKGDIEEYNKMELEYLEDKGEDSNESILYELLANNAGSIIDLRESLGGYQRQEWLIEDEDELNIERSKLYPFLSRDMKHLEITEYFFMDKDYVNEVFIEDINDIILRLHDEYIKNYDNPVVYYHDETDKGSEPEVIYEGLDDLVEAFEDFNTPVRDAIYAIFNGDFINTGYRGDLIVENGYGNFDYFEVEDYHVESDIFDSEEFWSKYNEANKQQLSFHPRVCKHGLSNSLRNGDRRDYGQQKGFKHIEQGVHPIHS